MTPTEREAAARRLAELVLASYAKAYGAPFVDVFGDGSYWCCGACGGMEAHDDHDEDCPVKAALDYLKASDG